MLDVNLEDITTVEEEVQQALTANENVMKVISIENKEVKDVEMESMVKVCSDFVPKTLPCPSRKRIQNLRTKSKVNVGANKDSLGRLSEKEKREKATKKDIMEGRQKLLQIGKKLLFPNDLSFMDYKGLKSA
ncbi:hypothetical protein KI387_006416, partial [Taxus chinensis]